MSLDAIKQGILAKLGAGDLCLWRKDGTLLTDGTLESNGVGRGHNLYAVLRASAMAAPAYARPEAGTVPVNHAGDFPGQITCGCARRASGGHHGGAALPPVPRGREILGLPRRRASASAYDRDRCASSTGCLAQGTCAPDPTCAPVIDVDGHDARRRRSRGAPGSPRTGAARPSAAATPTPTTTKGSSRLPKTPSIS